MAVLRSKRINNENKHVRRTTPCSDQIRIKPGIRRESCNGFRGRGSGTSYNGNVGPPGEPGRVEIGTSYKARKAGAVIRWHPKFCSAVPGRSRLLSTSNGRTDEVKRVLPGRDRRVTNPTINSRFAPSSRPFWCREFAASSFLSI